MKTLVIGVGNEYRGDDAVGLIVARRIRAESSARVSVREESGEGVALMEAWQGIESIILIDAVQAGGAPGTIYRFEAHAEPMPVRFFHYSTHAFSVAEAIELARKLNQLPARLIVYGIEGRDFEAGIGLSTEVEQAAQEVARRAGEELLRMEEEGHPCR